MIERRAFLGGLGSIAFASLLRGGTTHFLPKAKRVIHVCLCGGMSHVDSFDYKPALTRFHGKKLPGTEKPETFFGQIGLLRKPDWAFRQRGQSGIWISDLFPHIATMADELTVINSMVADSANHTPATYQENSGFRLNGFPALGSWLSYGLGADTEELPAFVVLPDPRGFPAGGTINWSSGFLPARHQGVPFRTRGPAIDELYPARPIAVETETATRDLLAELDRRHASERGDDSLAARLRGYELAGRMQLAVPKVTDLSREPLRIQESYGLHESETADFGRACLMARRLLEKGVRMVQLFSGGPFGSPRINWDGHEDVKANHTQEAKRVDQPVAALLRDLRQRGMLDDTLVLFTTEFGRTPFTQAGTGVVGKGRDHNHVGFSVWMAGAGLKKGLAYGTTDEIGWKSVDKPVYWYDFHATVLHLLGLDHERLTFYHNGIQRRLTNVHGEVVRAILA
ncbi:MAG: DUF1501 domain-containing protein [Planctomycetia bacterium]|nr:DUF1501 domain-containing protein [Planctomycetia bacterium]